MLPPTDTSLCPETWVSPVLQVNYLLLDYGERIRFFMGDCKERVEEGKAGPYDPCLR